jgi:hypothetical protein
VKKYLFLFVIAILAMFINVPVSVNSIPCSIGLSAVPATVDFGLLNFGATSTYQYVTFTNSGTCSETLISINETGDTFNVFSQDSGCTVSSTLNTGQSCTVGFQFTPNDGATDFTSRFSFTFSTSGIINIDLSGSGGNDNSAAIISLFYNKDDSSGCDATASTGVAGGKSFGPAALGFIAIMGLVLGVAAIRRRTKKSE